MSDPLKVAVVIYEPVTSDTSRVFRGLKTALEFKQAGDDVTVLFDGSGVESLALISDPNHPMHSILESIADKVQGACAFCSRSHNVDEAIKNYGWTLLTDNKGEASVRNLVAEGRQVLNF